MTTSSSETIAYLGLGSNLDSPVDQINKARISIRGIKGVTELAFSSLYISAPMGPQNQPDYVNAVMSIETTLSPMALLNELQTIERSQGRIRGDQRWCARTLDLDLLLYGDQVIDLPELTVPHPGMVDRPFVLYPLHECAPRLYIPGKGNVADLLEHCPIDGLRRLESD
ncbi:MAG: 2-amino-4-hydroxy-6-hydroxymethyldihydropteridine diphosphokinase [Methylococcaceae bacterium]|nr:2-amino-4-hydroxy-6-hydroxymethyldihydropteridine diphosphokinase [Methylococcaceae bacterium]